MHMGKSSSEEIMQYDSLDVKERFNTDMQNTTLPEEKSIFTIIIINFMLLLRIFTPQTPNMSVLKLLIGLFDQIFISYLEHFVPTWIHFLSMTASVKSMLGIKA